MPAPEATDVEDAAREEVRCLVAPSTFDAIERFLDAVAHWSRVTNLVSAEDRGRLWERHVRDSLRLVPLAEGAGPVWVDLGSGGGFPGMIVALAREGAMTMVEVNRKKAAFLVQAAATCGARVAVRAERIEASAPFEADVVSARALAPLPRLLPLASRFFGPHTRGLFPKGQEAEAEVAAAQSVHAFAARLHLGAEGPVVEVTDLRSQP